MGLWGWKNHEGWLKYAIAIGGPLLLMAIWGTFAVPNDPSRSGNAPIITPGIIRLLIELAFFALATWALHASAYPKQAIIFGGIVLLHYLISYDRILWLLSH